MTDEEKAERAVDWRWRRLEDGYWQRPVFMDSDPAVLAACELWPLLISMSAAGDGEIRCPRPEVDLPRLCFVLATWPPGKLAAALAHLAHPREKLPHLDEEQGEPRIDITPRGIELRHYEEIDPLLAERLRKRRERAQAVAGGKTVAARDSTPPAPPAAEKKKHGPRKSAKTKTNKNPSGDVQDCPGLSRTVQDGPGLSRIVLASDLPDPTNPTATQQTAAATAPRARDAAPTDTDQTTPTNEAAAGGQAAAEAAGQAAVFFGGGEGRAAQTSAAGGERSPGPPAAQASGNGNRFGLVVRALQASFPGDDLLHTHALAWCAHADKPPGRISDLVGYALATARNARQSGLFRWPLGKGGSSKKQANNGHEARAALKKAPSLWEDIAAKRITREQALAEFDKRCGPANDYTRQARSYLERQFELCAGQGP